LRQAESLQLLQEAAYLCVSGRYLPGVGVVGELLPKRRWGFVRGVRLVEVDPEEELAFAVPKPGDGGIHHLGTGALGFQPCPGVCRQRYSVVVDRKAPGKPEPPRQHVSSDERPSVPPLGGELLGKRGHVLRERVGTVEPHPVVRRSQTREDRSMGRQGERCGGPGLGETYPCGGQAINGGCGGVPLAPVDAHVVGPQGIHGDQQEVPRGSRRLFLFAAEQGPKGQKRSQQRNEFRAAPHL
jgi:hypothetical protein